MGWQFLFSTFTSRSSGESPLVKISTNLHLTRQSNNLSCLLKWHVSLIDVIISTANGMIIYKSPPAPQLLLLGGGGGGSSSRLWGATANSVLGKHASDDDEHQLNTYSVI